MTYFDLTKETVYPLFKARKTDTNKGDYGKALLIAGSYGMAGAGMLAAKGCLCAGVGLCEIACPDSIYPILATAVPEAVFFPYTDDLTPIRNQIRQADCVLVGCGCGDSPQTDHLLCAALENAKKTLIIDADGINRLSRNIDLLKTEHAPVILTPHPGEMARLCGTSVQKVQENRLQTAKDFALLHGVTVVLKGHETVIAMPDGRCFVNHSGNAGMATGGSGDLLAGILAAFLCIMPLDDAVCAAVFVHGLAGDFSAQRYSMTSTTPTTILKCLPFVFREIEQGKIV